MNRIPLRIILFVFIALVVACDGDDTSTAPSTSTTVIAPTTTLLSTTISTIEALDSAIMRSQLTEAAVRAFEEALGARNVDGMMAVMADDAVVTLQSLGEVYEGESEIRALFEGWIVSEISPREYGPLVIDGDTAIYPKVLDAGDVSISFAEVFVVVHDGLITLYDEGDAVILPMSE